MRITARLEPGTAQQLEYLVTRLGESTSEVLRKGIDALYKQYAKPDEPVLKYFSKHIGAYDLGDANWSVNYKEEFGRILDEKYPQHPVRTPNSEVSTKSTRRKTKP
jgi:sulfite reductase beta subunit-like hemoprotein